MSNQKVNIFNIFKKSSQNDMRILFTKTEFRNKIITMLVYNNEKQLLFEANNESNEFKMF